MKIPVNEGSMEQKLHQWKSKVPWIIFVSVWMES